ncbi:right-handed parallel beta-helix repeat-containing protein [Zhongshania borealis]|uniref:CSLREA domain-containing protein n=1 Tax=Zhongshania borealis TaxID=889488 RepID=A0ABP7WXB9_9GAMM
MNSFCSGFLNLTLPRLLIAAALVFQSACGGSSSSPGGDQNPSNTAQESEDNSPPFSPASPGTFIVDYEGDEPDILQGDGLCETETGGCSLRAAVQESNATILLSTNPFTHTNVIIMPPGHYKFIEPPLIPTVVAEGTSDAGMLSILGSTNIRGAGARKTILDGNGIDRVFGVGPNAILSISDLTITGGSASGIFNQGQLTVTRCTISGNTSGYGGGIFNTPSSSAIIDSSTISNNTAESEGGGIRFDAAGLVINSTISNNRILEDCCSDSTYDGGTQGEGGGIDARGGGPVTIINSTIVNNHAVIGGGGLNIATSYQGDPGGVFQAIGSEVFGRPVELINTIIAGNTSTRGPANCKNTISAIHSLGGNISDDDSCNLNFTNDQNSTDPELDELADNGGPTDTHAPFATSPALENGLMDRCPAQDQRGAQRETVCDSGAMQEGM